MDRFNPSLLEKLECESKSSGKNTIRTSPISQGEKLGGEFHIIMQQIGLGLPVEPFLKAYPQLGKWVEVLLPFIEIPGNKQLNLPPMVGHLTFYLRESPPLPALRE